MNQSIHETTTHRTHNNHTAAWTPTVSGMAATRAAMGPPPAATHSAHRKAFGPGKYRTPAQKAADVAASIAMRHDRGDAWDWNTYGLEGNYAQQKLVEAALAKLQYTAEEEDRLQAYYWEQEQARLEELDALEDIEMHGRW